MQYRRLIIPGTTYFFTVVLQDRRSDLLIQKINELRQAFKHVIRDELDYSRHLDYIHYNPVKHGYVRTPSEWQYSSIHRYINSGILPQDWACHDEATMHIFGE